MVRLADGEFVALELCQFSGKAKEFLHADGEVGAIEQPGLTTNGEGSHFVDLRIPAGGTDNDSASEREHGAHVFNGGFGSSEVDDDIYAGEHGPGERRCALVFSDVKSAHAVPAFASDLGD